MNYPDKNLTVATLLDAARKAAMNSSAQHPEDLAAEMVVALDGAASAVWFMHLHNLKRESPDEMGG